MWASVVVGLAGDDLVRAVDLLEQDDAGKLVGQGDAAEREAVVTALELDPERASDDEAEIHAAQPPALQKAAEAERVELLSPPVEQRDERPRRQAARDLSPVADLDQLKARVAPQQLSVVLNVVGERRTHPPHGDDHDPHGGILRSMADPNTPERHINIHFSPEVMAGHYANFANVSHSDYEFTLTFARVDHEIEDEEIPGVVVSRINLSPKFMRELIDAMQDNYSKWRTREGIKNLPEYGGEEPQR